MRNMHRLSASSPTPHEREAVALPCRPMGYQDWDTRNTYVPKMAEDRGFAPYQPKDLLFVNVRGTHDPIIKLARVVRVFSQFQDRGQHYIPKYRIQTATKAGYWSANWRYVYPGDIFRAYFDAAEQPRDLPAEIDAAWLARDERNIK